ALDRDRLAFAELVRDAIEGGDVKILLEFSGVAKQSQEARAFRRDVLPGDPCIFNDETCAALWHHSSPVRGPVIQFDGACIRCLMNSPSVRGRQSLQGSRSPQWHSARPRGVPCGTILRMLRGPQAVISCPAMARLPGSWSSRSAEATSRRPSSPDPPLRCRCCRA